MNDTISRAAALSALNGCTEIFLNNLPPTIYKTDAVEAVTALPSAQQWTPVTKRLPKAYESVNVTVQIPEGRYVQESALMDTGWKGISAPAEVVAWCPLPAPWKGDTP